MPDARAPRPGSPRAPGRAQVAGTPRSRSCPAARRSGPRSPRAQALDALDPELLHVEGGEHRAVGHGAAQARRGRAPRPARRGSPESRPRRSRPRPVGSITVSSGYAGSEKKPSSSKSAAPYSPCLTTTVRGPISITSCAARSSVGCSVSMRISSSFMNTMSTRADRAHQRVARGLDPEVHRVEAGQPRVLALLAHLPLQVRLDVGQEQHVGAARLLGQLRVEVAEHVQLRVVGVAHVQVPLVLAAPEEGLARPRRARCRRCSPRARAARAYSSSPKSSPTGPTTRTSVKKLAAREKCTADPPSMRSRSPKGVLTASKAIDPTTTRLIGGQSRGCEHRPSF